MGFQIGTFHDGMKLFHVILSSDIKINVPIAVSLSHVSHGTRLVTVMISMYSTYTSLAISQIVTGPIRATPCIS